MNPITLTSSAALSSMLDLTRKEALETKIRLETQVQKIEKLYLEQIEINSSLKINLEQKTLLVEQVQKKLEEQTKQTKDLSIKVEGLTAEKLDLIVNLDQEKAVAGDLEATLKQTNKKIEDLTSQLNKYVDEERKKKEDEEARAKWRAEQPKIWATFLAQSSIIMATPLGATLAGSAIAGPVGALIGCFAGLGGAAAINLTWDEMDTRRERAAQYKAALAHIS